MERIPLTEFDTSRKALIDPTYYQNLGVSQNCVIPFYGAVVEKLKREGRLTKVYQLGSVLIPTDIYKVEHNGHTILVASPTGAGAPLAGTLLDELIALGCRKIVACGSAAVIKSGLARDVIVIPTDAVRDEGTSYHYMPPSRTVTTEPSSVNTLERVLQKHNLPYEKGMTWTTDAPYRETKGKVIRRREEGCLVVEMECAALLTVAKFRGVALGQYLLAGDDLSGERWESRDWSVTSSIHENMFWLSVEACLEL